MNPEINPLKLHFFPEKKPLTRLPNPIQPQKYTPVYDGKFADFENIYETNNDNNTIVIIPIPDENNSPSKLLIGIEKLTFRFEIFFLNMENPLTFNKEYEGKNNFMLIIQHLYLF